MLLPDVLIPDSGLYSPAILIPAFICLSAALPSLSPHRNIDTGSVLTSDWSLTSCPGLWLVSGGPQSRPHISPPISLLTHNTRLGNFILLLLIPLNTQKRGLQSITEIFPLLICEKREKTLIWIWHFYLIADVGGNFEFIFFRLWNIIIFATFSARWKAPQGFTLVNYDLYANFTWIKCETCV